jgi:rhamnose utilization protein RhaD (predicted bifunctional aldolase and dehydrogenase)
MQSLWDEREATRFCGDLGLRVYSSTLLGREKSLVLHGGGNTSVKIREQNLVGEAQDILYVKGSGWDLEFIEEQGFSPVRMAPLLKLAKLDSLSDPEMVNELKACMTRASAPSPSVETILHAVLPHKYVDHTHADTVLAITNTKNGLKRVREIYDDIAVVIPYVMPGFDLALACARIFPAEANENTIGMILMNHGVFSFGKTARESYERMIHLVTLAEEYLKSHGAWEIPIPKSAPVLKARAERLAQLRAEISNVIGFPVILCSQQDDLSLHFARRKDVANISQQGPTTPDHVIRTKRLPMLGTNVQSYCLAYQKYFAENASCANNKKIMLDPAPRVILDPELGMCSVGYTAKDTTIVAHIYKTQYVYYPPC